MSWGIQVKASMGIGAHENWGEAIPTYLADLPW